MLKRAANYLTWILYAWIICGAAVGLLIVAIWYYMTGIPWRKEAKPAVKAPWQPRATGDHPDDYV